MESTSAPEPGPQRGRSDAPLPHPRARDEQGRPRNARPRDELGRPLPPGAPGTERVPEDIALPPLEALAEAQRLLDAGRPFHAHEVLEGTWKAAPEPERELWRGLAQLAVGLTHAGRGNEMGAIRLLHRAANRIAAYSAEPPYGIRVGELVDWARTLAAEIKTDGLAGRQSPEPTPRLCEPWSDEGATGGDRLR